MTTMLDRYLHAVADALPKDVAADDVTAEIGDDLRSRIDEREEEVGRALNDDETAAIITSYGHPRVVAARYGRVQWLIGPELLPFYWSTLQLVTTAIVALELIAGGISAIVTSDGLRFFGALDAAFHSLVWIFTIVTAIFAIAERVPHGAARLDAVMRFDPRALPAPAALPPVQRSSSLAEFIANTLALLVLLDAPGPHRVPLDRLVATMLRDLHLTPTSAWHPALVGTSIGTALLALGAIAAFVRPQLSSLHEAVRVAASLVTIVGIAMTLTSGPLLTPPGGAANTVALALLALSIAILALQTIVSVRRVVRRS